jgi:flagellar protein FliO/FliZ
MKFLAIFITALLASTGMAGTAKKFSPPSALDYSVEVNSGAADPDGLAPVEETSTVILEKEMEANAVPPMGVDGQRVPQTVSVPVSGSVSESKVEIADKNLREDQIPVLREKEKVAEATSQNFFHKVVAAGTMVLLMIGGLAFTTRKYFQKAGVPNKHTNIRVVTQHSLGAKKNLAIVSVAGEYILLGVTDHNINLIKTLSLMDDEIPEQTPSKFNAALKSAEARPDFVELTGVKPNAQEAEEGFSIRNLKEVVSQKLRGMKEFS